MIVFFFYLHYSPKNLKTLFQHFSDSKIFDTFCQIFSTASCSNYLPHQYGKKSNFGSNCISKKNENKKTALAFLKFLHDTLFLKFKKNMSSKNWMTSFSQVKFVEAMNFFPKALSTFLHSSTKQAPFQPSR